MKDFKELTQKDVDECDYFNDRSPEFYAKLANQPLPKLVQGKHREKEPLITILIPTYKRPELLKNAIDSALDQGEFDNYQIIIVDNECAPIDEETDTSILVSGYADERIIYYRNEIQAFYKMDNAARLARSKWILFLHDDDVLVPDSLIIRIKILEQHPEIKFLSSGISHFFDYNVPSHSKYSFLHYKLYKFPPQYIDREYFPSWLGALIDRESYIELCGMQNTGLGIGDMEMCEKFHFYIGIHSVDVGIPLYYYRRWRGQSATEGDDLWQYLYRNEYYLQRYVVRKCHFFFRKFWDRTNAYKILDKALKGNLYKTKVDINRLITESGMQKGVDNKKSIRYKVDKIVLRLSNLYVNMIYRPLIDEGTVEC